MVSGQRWIHSKGVFDSCESDDSWDAPIYDFNFDSKYLIEMRGLPWSATKNDVKHFFKNVSILNDINGIHFILDEKSIKNGRALVQLEGLQDLKVALKCHKQHMDNRYIEGLTFLYAFNICINSK